MKPNLENWSIKWNLEKKFEENKSKKELKEKKNDPKGIRLHFNNFWDRPLIKKLGRKNSSGRRR